MGKIQGKTQSEALHVGLCSAISDLAQSVEFAVKRKALRAEIATTLTGATKVANAAAELRAAAYSTDSRQNPASLISQAPTTQGQAQDTWTRTTLVPDVETTAAEVQDTWTRAASDCDVVGEQPEKRTIATSILEIYDRLGSFTARR
jgi:hypothetical protein